MSIYDTVSQGSITPARVLTPFTRSSRLIHMDKHLESTRAARYGSCVLSDVVVATEFRR